MHRARVGDFVWVGQAGSAIPAVIEEIREAVGSGVPGRRDSVKVRYCASQGKPYLSLREFISENFVRAFQTAFEDNALAYISKSGSASVLEDIAKEMGWAEGIARIQDFKPVTARKHPRSELCSCAVCHRVIGGTIPCQVCCKVYVHRKCGKVEGASWTCDKCSSNSGDSLELRRSLSDSRVTATNTLLLARSVSEQPSALISKDRLQPEVVLEKIKDQAKEDGTLYQVIVDKQRSYRKELTDFEARKQELKALRMPDQDFRMALFRCQEANLKALTQLRKELADQLQGAQVFGFESIKVLLKRTSLHSVDPSPSEQETYRRTQRTVVDRLFTVELRPGAPTPPQRSSARVELRKGKTLGTVMLDSGSSSCVLHLLAKCMKKVKEVETKNELTLPLLSAIVKVAHDATFSRVLGSGTDPSELERLLLQIRHRY